MADVPSDEPPEPPDSSPEAEEPSSESEEPPASAEAVADASEAESKLSEGPELEPPVVVGVAAAEPSNEAESSTDSLPRLAEDVASPEAEFET